MRKKLLITLSVMTMVTAMSTSVFARGYSNNSPRMMYQNSNYSTGYGFMLDEDGDFLSEDEFEERLNYAIDNNLLDEDEKDFYLNMFDYCTSNTSSFRNSNNGTRRGFSCH